MEELSDGLHEKQKHGRKYGRLLDIPCECEIEPPGSISHVVSFFLLRHSCKLSRTINDSALLVEAKF